LKIAREGIPRSFDRVELTVIVIKEDAKQIITPTYHVPHTEI